MKKTLLLAISFVIVSATCMFAQFGGGTGTATNPYIISSTAHLKAMHNVVYTPGVYVYFRLEDDVDMKDETWTPLYNGNQFVNFDGNGHVIKNLSVSGVNYASMFGVLCGTVKNLGIINANIETTSSGGILTGYVGMKAPSTSAHTGVIENCYTTGIIKGAGLGIGGITGSIGNIHAASGTSSVVKNCYSTATVISSTGVVGGIAGRNYAGKLENCYSTGTVVTPSGTQAGGIIGWTSGKIVGCVSFNDSIISKKGNAARIFGYGKEGEKCWADENTVVMDSTTVRTQYVTTKTTETTDGIYDGLSKNSEFLSNVMNYFEELGWDFASDNNVWSQNMYKGYPIFQWLANRSDFAEISGLDNLSSGINNLYTVNYKTMVNDYTVTIVASNIIESLKVYTLSGQCIHTSNPGSSFVSYDLKNKGVYILFLKIEDKCSYKKLIIK